MGSVCHGVGLVNNDIHVWHYTLTLWSFTFADYRPRVL